MKDYIEERVKELAQQCIDTHATVREFAERNNISKSTVHKDLSERLQKIDAGLYKEVKAILKENGDQKHIRGGEATRQKYLARRSHLY